MKTEKIIIFDLDGTLANIDVRKSKATKENGEMDWTEFFNPEYIKSDTPIYPVIETFKALKQTGYKMFIMTGRDVSTRDETNKWLANNGIIPDFIVMRKKGDRTPDDIL